MYDIMYDIISHKGPDGLLNRPDWNRHRRLHRNITHLLFNVCSVNARGHVLQQKREHLGIFLHIHVCERALISKVTLLVRIH